ncbi:MAG: hypothetical protein QOI11_3047 [Candidatus Eremiobacteraeota bacterium]|nr:hypothetical protein [Candidatus Eremiobacteraeota bacterium]
MSIHYDSRKLLQYEWSDRADHAKKILEKRRIDELVRELVARDGQLLSSLDIGSATGRYPLWFNEHGFHAVGYDISPEAVAMARLTARGRTNIEFHVRNVLEIEPEPERFAVVTCMMGTLNHIVPEQQERLFAWVRASLRPGGVFLFSSWNRECPYTSYLRFYTRAEQEFIERNALTAAQVLELAARTGFEPVRVSPVCFLTDQCYDAWTGELGESDIYALDDFLGGLLRPSNAQMFVTGLRRPARGEP